MNHVLAYIIWNPSEGIHLGSFTLRFYSLMFVISFLFGWQILSKIYKKENVDKKYLDPLLIYTVLATIIGARLGQVFFYEFSYYKNHLLEALFPIRENPNASLLYLIKGYEFIGYRGLASHGATLALIISTYIYSKKVLKKPFLWLCDRIVIPVALACCFIRIGNFFNSEILGKPSLLPWAVKFIQMDSDYGMVVPRHPAQLYEAFTYLIIFFIIRRVYKKGDKKHYLGYIFGLFFLLLWTMRFFIEFLKEPQGKEMLSSTFLNTGQLLSIPFILFSLYLIWSAPKRKYPPTA